MISCIEIVTFIFEVRFVLKNLNSWEVYDQRRHRQDILNREVASTAIASTESPDNPSYPLLQDKMLKRPYKFYESIVKK